VLDRITPLILTLNEAPNIGRTLERLAWAGEIVVVDSGSTDGTREILARHPKVRVVERRFTTHAEQWNFALHESGVRSDWVLALDADYVLSEALVRELSGLAPGPEVGGYRARFIYCMEGKPLHGGVYPPGVVLYRRQGAEYVQDGHTQRVSVKGQIVPLAAPIYHDDRKPLGQWLAAQARYMELEADKLLRTPFGALSFPDRLRRLIVIAPPAMFLHCLLLRGGVLDGKSGLLYALQRATAEAILSMFLLSRVLR
jgi:glycosyltransferase involved in cell wall biosynthesis